MKLSPASGSIAPSVATTVPAAAFSCTAPPATTMSVGASFSSLIAVSDGLGIGHARAVGDGHDDVVRASQPA